MDFRKIVSTYAPLVPAIAVAAAVMIGLSGYETPTYAVTEHPAESLTEEPAQKIPVSQEKEETEEIGTGAFDVPDGTYQGSGTGFGGTVTVSVTIREKTITAIDVLSHADTPSFFARAESRVIPAILAMQTADVDGVSGATLSSNGIKQAVRNALHAAAGEQTEALAAVSVSRAASAGPAQPVSRIEEPSGWRDGIYTGSGVGFAGAVTTVEVTVSGGKIASVRVLSYGDTTSYFLNAQNPVISAILAGQTTNVDTVSGATFSSNGIISAVRDALAKAAKEETEIGESEDSEPEEPETEEFDFPDGIYVGTGEGYNDDIILALTIRDKAIVAITVLYEDDTPEFFGMAQAIIRTVVNTQNTEVDTVSGATYSSNGILEAIKDALENAGKGVTITDLYEEKKESAETDEADSPKTEPEENGSVSDNDPDDGKETASGDAPADTSSDTSSDDSSGDESTSDSSADTSSADPAGDDSGESSSDESVSEPDAHMFRNGTFSGSAVCTPDEDRDFDEYTLTLTIVMQDDRITAVTDILGDGDADNDSFISRAANGTKRLTGTVTKIVAAGSADGIDTVSGATCSSKAIIAAVQNAMEKARK